MASTPTIESAPDLEAWGGPRALSPLRHRDFALFWSGSLISNVGTAMQMMALGWLVFELTGSELYLGVVGMAATLPMLLLALPSGVMADRLSKRRIVIATQTLAMVQASVLTVLVYTGAIRPWHILLLAAFMGLVNAFDVPARQSMTIELVGKRDLLNAIALNSTAFNGARIIGPAIAGAIVAARGAGACFLVNAVSYLAVIAGLVMVRTRPPKRARGTASVLAQIGEGLRHARRDCLIRDILVLTGVFSVFGMQYGTVMPAFAKNVLKVGPGGLGGLMSAAGFGALAGALSIAALGHRFRRGMIAVSGALLAPLGLAAFSRCSCYAPALACLVVTGFGAMLFLAVSNSVVQTASPDELRGRMLSVRTLAFMGLAPLGALQIGWVSQAAGVRTGLLIGGIACIVASFCCGLRSKAVRDAE